MFLFPLLPLAMGLLKLDEKKDLVEEKVPHTTAACTSTKMLISPSLDFQKTSQHRPPHDKQWLYCGSNITAKDMDKLISRSLVFTTDIPYYSSHQAGKEKSFIVCYNFFKTICMNFFYSMATINSYDQKPSQPGHVMSKKKKHTFFLKRKKLNSMATILASGPSALSNKTDLGQEATAGSSGSQVPLPRI